MPYLNYGGSMSVYLTSCYLHKWASLLQKVTVIRYSVTPVQRVTEVTVTLLLSYLYSIVTETL